MTLITEHRTEDKAALVQRRRGGVYVNSTLTTGDREFLAALRKCPSRPVRMIAIALDTVSASLRLGPPDPDSVADRLDQIGLDLLALAAQAARQRAAA